MGSCEISAAVESVLNAPADAAPLEDTVEDTGSALNMTPGKLPEAHEATLESEAYSVDLTEPPESELPAQPPVPDAEESDWGFGEPKQETQEEPPAPPEPPVPPKVPKAAGKSDRQLFYELKFNELDRGLTPEERQEWNSIYASYRGRSAITGRIIGVDPLSIYVWNRETEQREKKTMYCAIVVPYRVRIVIPASEMWEEGGERPDYVLQNMVGANVDLVIIKVEREAGFAIGSRRLAGRSQRYFFAHREDLHRIGARVKCRLLAVGPRRCLADCYGHDLDLTQREMRYAAIPDNAGLQPQDIPCVEDGPAAYFATVPVREMARAIAQAGLPGSVSYTVGTFVCNDLLYTLLHHYRDTAARVGFIHVPFLPEQARDGQPALALNDIVRALCAAIETL